MWFIIFIIIFIIIIIIILKNKNNSTKFNLDFIKKYENQDIYYNTFFIPKRDWTRRKIQAPNNKLKIVQKKILKELEKRYFLPNFVTAFRKNFSIKYNAKKHTNKKVVINIDIKDFFSNVTSEMLEKRFKFYKNIKDEDIQKFIKLTTNNWSIPQGAPTSPFLANFVFLPIDYIIINLLKKYDKNVSYTRYADDLTFSSNNVKIKNAIRIITDWILPKYWFEAKKKKTTIYRKHTRQLVTGLVVNTKVAYPRAKYMILRSMIYNFITKWKWDSYKIKWYLSFLRFIDYKKYKILKKYYSSKFKNNLKYNEIF